MVAVRESMFTVTAARPFEWIVTLYLGDGRVVEHWVRGPRWYAKRVGYKRLKAASTS